MNKEKLKIVTTADLFGADKKKGTKKILTTKDIPDYLPVNIEQKDKADEKES